MTRLLTHAGALACALLVAALFYAAFRATLLEAATIFGALTVVGWGLCVGRDRLIALVPAGLAALALLLIGFNLPAAAATAHKTAPLLTAIEAPVQPLALAAPTAPQQVVVSVAQPDTATASSVALPIAQWLGVAQAFLATVLMGLLGKGLAKLPAPLVWAVKMYGEDKIVQQAIALAVNAVPGAAKGTPLTIDVGNSVLAHALQWVVNTVPKFAVSMMGGEDAIKAKIFAALHLEPDASAAAMGVKATA